MSDIKSRLEKVRSDFNSSTMPANEQGITGAVTTVTGTVCDLQAITTTLHLLTQ